MPGMLHTDGVNAACFFQVLQHGAGCILLCAIWAYGMGWLQALDLLNSSHVQDTRQYDMCRTLIRWSAGYVGGLGHC